MRFSVIFATTIISAADAFVNCKNWMKAHNDVSMKWTFSKSGYPSQDFGSGNYYLIIKFQISKFFLVANY